MMGCRRLAFAVFVLSLFIAAGPAPARANGAAALAAASDVAPAETRIASIVGVFHHSRKARSYYCYPRTYWWFYRPYTTAPQEHPRCMPYFHIPGQDQYFKRGAGTGRLK